MVLRAEPAVGNDIGLRAGRRLTMRLADRRKFSTSTMRKAMVTVHNSPMLSG